MAEIFQIRVSEQEQARFKEVAAELGLKHGECLTAILNAFEADKASRLVPGTEQDVGSFMDHLSQIQRLFTSAIVAYGQQRDIERERVRHELESKDKNILDLQKRLEIAEARAKDAIETKEKLEQAETDLAEARKTIEALTKIRDSAPDPEKYKQMSDKVVSLEAASAEKDKLIKMFMDGRQTDIDVDTITDL